jgi:hypothetical protein
MVISDEAQIMTEKAVDAQTSTMNTSSFGLAIYAGTPPRPDDPSEAFTRMHDEAWDGTLEDAVWIEVGGDPAGDPDDPKQWAQANPSYPHRTPTESILRQRRKLTLESFRREGLGIWDDGGTDPWGVIPRTRWRSRVTDHEDPDRSGWLEGPVTLCVESDSDQIWTTVAVAGGRPDAIGFAVIGRYEGTGWVVDAVSALDVDIAHIVIDDHSFAAPLVAPLEAAGFTVTVPKTNAVATATATLIDLFNKGGIEYRDSPELTASAACSKLRKYGEGRVINRAVGDPSALIAANLAVWGHQNQPDDKPAGFAMILGGP